MQLMYLSEPANVQTNGEIRVHNPEQGGGPMKRLECVLVLLALAAVPVFADQPLIL